MPESFDQILAALQTQGLTWEALTPGEVGESVLRLYACAAVHDGERVRRVPIASAALPAGADLMQLRAYTVDALRKLEAGKAKDYGNQNTRPHKPGTETGDSCSLVPSTLERKPEELMPLLVQQVERLAVRGLSQTERSVLLSSLLSGLSLLYLTRTLTDLNR